MPSDPSTNTRSAAPSLGPRLLALLAVLVAGACGGLIGYSFTDLQCDDECTTLAGGMGVLGAATAATGVAVVAVLTLRAMAEWQAKEHRARSGSDSGRG
jgi:hypothetical protein